MAGHFAHCRFFLLQCWYLLWVRRYLIILWLLSYKRICPSTNETRATSYSMHRMHAQCNLRWVQEHWSRVTPGAVLMCTPLQLESLMRLQPSASASTIKQKRDRCGSHQRVSYHTFRSILGIPIPILVRITCEDFPLITRVESRWCVIWTSEWCETR